MGGQNDKEGQVMADKLIKVITDFQMTIDIETLIAEVDKDGSGAIDYEEFRDMLTENNQTNALDQFKDLFFS